MKGFLAIFLMSHPVGLLDVEIVFGSLPLRYTICLNPVKLRGTRGRKVVDAGNYSHGFDEHKTPTQHFFRPRRCLSAHPQCYLKAGKYHVVLGNLHPREPNRALAVEGPACHELAHLFKERKGTQASLLSLIHMTDFSHQ